MILFQEKRENCFFPKRFFYDLRLIVEVIKLNQKTCRLCDVECQDRKVGI